MEDFPFGTEKFMNFRSELNNTCIDWISDECYDFILTNQLYLGRENIEIVISANVDCVGLERNIEWNFNENVVNMSIIYGEKVNRKKWFSVRFLGKTFRLPGWVLVPKRDLDSILSSLIITIFRRSFNEDSGFALAKFSELQSEMVYQILCLYFICAIFENQKVTYFSGIYPKELLYVCKMIEKISIKNIKNDESTEYARFYKNIIDGNEKNELPMGKKSFKTLYRYIFWLYKNFY